MISEESPTYIVAEIGINHNGDEDIAALLVEKAAEAGADAVKFQKRHLPELYVEDLIEHPEKYEQHYQYLIPLLKRVELSDKALLRMKDLAHGLGMDFLCTPFDKTSADFLASLDIDAFKIASADLTNIVLLEHVVRFGKPLIISTGMSKWNEIEEAVSILKKSSAKFALLHCRSVYPVRPSDIQLSMLDKLKRFHVPVGYSGHELGTAVAVAAAAMGASIIEKHFTLDRKQQGPDHKVSLEPHEFSQMVRDIKIVDEAIGNVKNRLLRGEVLNRELLGKSIVASCDIEQGAIITREKLEIKGPGKGLSPIHINKLVGRKSVRHLRKGDFFFEHDIKPGLTENPVFSFSSKWGLIARFSDFERMLQFGPKVIEFHLAEKDLGIPFRPMSAVDCMLVVHAPEYMCENILDLCSQDDELRRLSVEVAIKTIELADRLAPFFKDTPKIIVHPGAMSLKEDKETSKLEFYLSQSIDAIREKTYKKDVELLLENLPPYPWYFGGQWHSNYFMDAEQIVSFCKKFQLKICFDLSHCALYCNAKSKDLINQIKILMPFISHLHLADGYGIDGEGVQFGEGDIDFPSILPLFKDFDGTWVPEVWRGHLNNGEGFLQALRFLSDYMT